MQSKLFSKKEADIEYYGKRVNALWDKLETRMSDQIWIAGTTKPSIADISAWSEIYATKMAGVDFQVYPNLKAWMDRFVKFHITIELWELKSRNLVHQLFIKENIPKLIYFELGGRGEQIRIACAVAGLKYIDERVSFAEFGKRKAAGEFPSGAIPVWIEDGDTYF